MPIGRPSAFQVSGNEIAGEPAMFASGVYGTKVAARMKPRSGSSGVVNSPSGHGRLAERRGEQQVVAAGEPRLDAHA